MICFQLTQHGRLPEAAFNGADAAWRKATARLWLNGRSELALQRDMARRIVDIDCRNRRQKRLRIAAYFSFANREETPHGVNSDPLSTAEKGKTIVEESIETLA